MRAVRAWVAVAVAAFAIAACSTEPTPRAARPAPPAAPSRAAPAKPTATVSLTVTGSQPFDGELGDGATCTFSENNGQHELRVEAFGRDAQLTFTLSNPREGTMLVSLAASGRRGSGRVTGLQVAVHGQSYAAGSGSAMITDPLGRSGTLNASSFTKLGVKRHARRGSDLRVHAEWHCD